MGSLHLESVTLAHLSKMTFLFRQLNIILDELMNKKQPQPHINLVTLV